MINLRQVEVFYAVMRAGSITEASSSATSPRISRRVLRAENENWKKIAGTANVKLD